MFGLPTVIDRCGVIAGPWQMGKVDQGVFTYWVLAHHFGRPLRYIGYGGTGKQVRDLLHVDDLVDLIDAQLARPDALGRDDGQRRRRARAAASRCSRPRRCAASSPATRSPIGAAGETRPGDVPHLHLRLPRGCSG